MRKGQISLFIIFGLIILIAFGLISYLNNQKGIKGRTVQQTTSLDLYTPIENYVDGCVKSSAEEAILNNAFQGGFYNETSNSVVTGTLFYSFLIPIYSNGRLKQAPSIQKLEEQISFGAEDSTLVCIDNFKVFNDKGFEIKFEKPNYKTKILDNQVFLETNFPIIVMNNGKVIKSFDRFFVSVPSRYKLVYAIADQIATMQSQKPDKVCVSCLIDYAFKNDLNISVENFDDKTIVITIVDQKIRINNKDLVFNFAHSIGDSSA